MRLWPFGKRIEKRQDGTSYTDVVTRALVAAATGEEVGTAAGTAALETCASLYESAFRSATITPRNDLTMALTPMVIGNIAREMLTRGESMYLVSVMGGEVKLSPCGSWDIRGGADPSAWRVRVDTYGPTSSSTTTLVDYSSVLHFRWSFDSALPWVGVGPATRAGITGRLHGALEQSLAHEAAGPVGHVLAVPPLPEAPEDEERPIDVIRRDVANLRGKTAVTGTTAGGFDQGGDVAPKRDWAPTRIGADPPATLAEIRQQSAEAVLASAGVPAALFSAGGDAAGRREAFRFWAHTGLAGCAAIVQEELRLKLEVRDLQVDLTGLHAADITSRSRAYSQMVKAGMPPAKAAQLTGLS